MNFFKKSSIIYKFYHPLSLLSIAISHRSILLKDDLTLSQNLMQINATLESPKKMISKKSKAPIARVVQIHDVHLLTRIKITCVV